MASPGMILLRVILTALLLSNLRATWIAANWKPGADDAAMPMRLSDTLTDKFANDWPTWIWPKLKLVYYILSIGWLLLVGLVLMAIALGLNRR